MRNFFTFLFFILITGANVLPQSVIGYKYVSPLPESKFNSREETIIFRDGNNINPASLSNARIKIYSDNRKYEGTFILSTDRKTVIFDPKDNFAPSEKITVMYLGGIKNTLGKELKPFKYSFYVTSLEKPVIVPKLAGRYYDGEDDTAITPKINYKTKDIKNTKSIMDVPFDFPQITMNVNENSAFDGATFLTVSTAAPNIGYYYMIIDNNGNPIFYDKTEEGSENFHLLPNGNTVINEELTLHGWAGGSESNYLILDSNFTHIDTYQMKNGYMADSHEFLMLPNGHVIMNCYDLQPVDLSNDVEGGKPNAMVAGSIMQELDNDKNVVFQWRSWDHFNYLDTYFNTTLAAFDPIHINSIELTIEGNLLISSRNLNEITKINRQTGEIIWRLGGKNNQFTFIGEDETNKPLYFSRTHDVRQLPNGNITVFDNGMDRRSAKFSRAVEYKIDEINKTAELVFEYRHVPDIYAQFQGSFRRLPNGNMFIGWGSASGSGSPAFSEITPDKKVVSEMTWQPAGLVSYRALKYPKEFLKPQANIDQYEIALDNTYEFNEDVDSTFVTLNIKNISGEGYNKINVQKFNLAPFNPQFLGTSPLVYQYRFYITNSAINSMTAELIIDLKKFSRITEPSKVVVYHRENLGQGLFLPLATTYNSVTGELKTTMNKFGEFILATPSNIGAVTHPNIISPLDNGKVNQTLPVTLKWNSDGEVISYSLQVSFKDDFSELLVNEENINETKYYMPSLENLQKYYWRVKATNDSGESEWTNAMFSTVAPYIQILEPNGGETFTYGQKHYIKWEDNITEAVKILLYRDDHVHMLVIDSTASDRAYLWELGSNGFVSGSSKYRIVIQSRTKSNIADSSDAMFTVYNQLAVVDKNELPQEYAVAQNYPNPFNPTTTIDYELPKASYVTVSVYNILGKEIATLVEGEKSAGYYQVTWNAENLPSGIYFYTFKAGNKIATKKMILVK
ncbi:MAG: aryl-sulfate sulfotransferase [Melioribacteraceae bacterium]|nr:aryl-sulfate sulfotransferase [Melioribacteraceae bacterium]